MSLGPDQDVPGLREEPHDLVQRWVGTSLAAMHRCHLHLLHLAS